MGTAAELNTEIKKLYSTNILAQLTNDDNTTTTVNDTRLTAASNRAMGEFRILAGFEPDTSTPNFYHIACLEHGVLYYLEKSKEGFFNVATDNRKTFFNMAKSLRETAAAPITISSPFERTDVDQGTKVDMDFDREAMNKGQRIIGITETQSGI